ncbi:MAG: MBL fold metallo-hydrolase [Mailhella sp.]|nr:MBL fold metallo-hydrolase [Mailhella sp.]
MKKWTRRMVLAGLAGTAMAGGGCAFYNSTRFGKIPEGDDLARLAASPHFRNGIFVNEEPTPLIVEDGRKTRSVLSTWISFMLGRGDRTVPAQPLPALVPDFPALDRDAVVWLGHSSVYIRLGGMRLLIDPVFSSHASPLPVAMEAFPGTNAYSAVDFPDIDILLISHDHWDHLDYPTMTALASKVRSILCPLGVGSHLVRFGFPRGIIEEGDWGQCVRRGGLAVHFTTSRHFSGRTFTRNRTLWGGFVIAGNGKKIFFSGDGGYGRHFARIGEEFGGFDLAMLDTGQYNPEWRHVHMDPDETAAAADDVRCRMLLPVHIGKFCLSYHPWDEPFERIAAAAPLHGWKLTTPRMGEPLLLDVPSSFSPWWNGLA